jgi:hypothetical protein
MPKSSRPLSIAAYALLIPALFLGACGGDSAKTVTLFTGLEGSSLESNGATLELSRLLSPVALVSSPLPTCKQMDVRVGFGAPGVPPTMIPVDAASTNLSSASDLSDVISSLRIRPIQLKLPRYVNSRVVFFASITTGFPAVSGQECPRLNLGAGPPEHKTYSFHGSRDVVIEQQEVVDLRVWGIYSGSTTAPNSATCPGGDCPASHFIKVLPQSTGLASSLLMIEYNSDLGTPARQILPSSGTYYVPKARNYRISKVSTGAGASITTCNTLLTQQDINGATAAPYSFPPSGSTYGCATTGYSLAEFSNP